LSIVFNALRPRFLTTGFAWASMTAPPALLTAQLMSTAFVPDPTLATRAGVPMGQALTGTVQLTGLTVDDIGVAHAVNIDFGVLTTVVPVGGILIWLQTQAETLAGDVPLLWLDQGAGFGNIVNNIDCQVIWDTRGIFSP
jgi:hypothetical protein